MHIRSAAFAALAAAAMWFGAGKAAHALTLHAGDSVIYNFDFTGAVPPPPYALYMDSNFLFGDSHGGDMVSFQLFGGIDGGGALVGTVPSMQVPLFSIGMNVADPDFLDGIYSIRLIADQGEFDLLAVTARAFNVAQEPIAEIAAALAVPEPASALLLASMLPFAAALRRRV